MVNNMAQTKDFFDIKSLPVVYHPGETLDEELQEMDMGIKEFATRVSKPEKTIIAVIQGKSSITPDMALAFEMVTRIPAHLWLRLQKNYDEYQARKKRAKILQQGLEWAEKFPIEEMIELGWLDDATPAEADNKNIVAMLCAFFAVSSPKGWEDFYLNQKLRVAFRITLAEARDPYALSAWLRQGEIQSKKISLQDTYSAKALRSILNGLSEIKNNGISDYKHEAVKFLNSAGVKLIFTEPLSSAPVKGCTRYIRNIPCIQMTAVFESESDFWQTLFHEIGHILLHGKKDIFIENVDYGDRDPEKEKEADDFASLWMAK